ncbi:MAG: Gfo/Idh/MocA family oxidoreductase [candidate division Zixibacteria bacterium]|nr:Gfo/Idh/MocA family oxidoreductase [candidate division Zixibacteria bacterium]
MGLIGAGHIARMHAAVWQQEAQVTAVCSRQRDKAERIAAEFGIPQIFDTADELIHSSSIDAICIATPHHLHHPLAMSALNAGKHVFCEKPLAIDLSQAREMCDLARQTGLKTGIQTAIRTGFPPLIHLKNLLQDDALGPVRYFEGVWGFDWARRADYPMGWRFRTAEGGTGALGDLGVYMIDAALWLAGKIDRVCADLTTHIARRPQLSERYDFSESRRLHRQGMLPPPVGWADVENDDACTLLLHFRGGGQGMIRATRLSQRNTICIETADADFAWDRQDETLQRRNAGEDCYIPEPVPDFPKTSIATSFLRNIETDENAPPTFFDGLRIQEVMEAAVVSAKERRWVEIQEVTA